MTANVVRIDVVRWQFGQFLVSIGLGAGVVARRWGNLTFQLSVGALYLYVLVVLWRARRCLGWNELHFADGQLQLGDTEIPRNAFLYWTIDDRGAHLCGLGTSWRLRIGEADRGRLEQSLCRTFGAPLPLAYRGSPLARAVAAGLSLGCLSAIGVGLGSEVPGLVAVGVVGGVLASGAWQALSQKVATIPDRRPRQASTRSSPSSD